MNKIYNDIKKKSLIYHSKFPPGKIKIVPTKSYKDQKCLSLAYSPGVAEPCKIISRFPDRVYNYTTKGNLVAVITNGSAVLGLGNIGALASKPVMEGKALLFKIFAGIDVFDIEINECNPNKFIDIVTSISPTFGGINLEDIKAPEAFKIEKLLKKKLDIPIMHDDQHGTAIISGAALINALYIVNKNIKNVKMIINGAGSAAISCAKIYKKLGINSNNILMFDSKGLIHNERYDLTKEKKEFSTFIKSNSKVPTLEQSIKNSDIFIGLSVGGILNIDMLKSMNNNPIVFAMANPNPEIDYNLATNIRPDIIMATGRSDYPNQVNNVLGFPYIFRGALDVQSKEINDEMKLAAIYAISKLAKEPVPDNINIIYNEKKLSFGNNYIIPKPFDQRLLTKVSIAVAKAAIKSGVARKNINDWKKYEIDLMKRI